MSGSLPWVLVGASTGVEGVTRVTVATETLMHMDCGALPAAVWRLVDRCVLAGALEEHVLAGVELASPRQRALGLLCHRTLEQRANLAVRPMILGRRGL